jgi:hypothetical protein
MYEAIVVLDIFSRRMNKTMTAKKKKDSFTLLEKCDGSESFDSNDHCGLTSSVEGVIRLWVEF